MAPNLKLETDFYYKVIYNQTCNAHLFEVHFVINIVRNFNSFYFNGCYKINYSFVVLGHIELPIQL